MTSRHARVALLDRYVRIPTVSRGVTPEMVAAVRRFWQEQGLALEPLLPPDGQGTPALWGEIPGPAGAPTVLLIPSANSDNQQHDVNEHYVLRHFFMQAALYARIVSSRP